LYKEAVEAIENESGGYINGCEKRAGTNICFLAPVTNRQN
jgi:hypothetical protein